jgi:diguanylate cyclase (GGDEF)-like protein
MSVWNLGARLTTFLIVAALVVRLRESRATQDKLALSDPLTGLANARAFFDRLSSEIDRALRYGSIFTLAYMDLDHFKEVNDRLGHAEGDEVLRAVGRTMREATRATDLTARLGGDEFGLLLPETPYGKAESALGKLQSEILTAMKEGGWPVTVSMGAVTFEAPVDTADDAARIADGLMYEVKDAGGDGVRHQLWTGEPGHDPTSAARRRQP